MNPDEYRRVTRELSRETMMPDGIAASLEHQLERAFEESTIGERKPTRAPHERRMLWWAAAAALVLLIGGTAWGLRGSANANLKSDQSTRANTGGVAGRPDVNGPALEETGVHQRPALSTGPKRAPAGRGRPLPPIVQPAGFVPVPAASKLPQFESGVIVRVALPVAALPSYGVDISPASSAEAVEADVLVGQDGLARAIRLVNASRSQQ